MSRVAISGFTLMYVISIQYLNFKVLIWDQKGMNLVICLSLVGYIDEGMKMVEEEMKRTDTERKAFGQFYVLIKQINPQVKAKNEIRDQPAMLYNKGGKQLEEVREAYRETVMSVPHYDEEYRESLEENMAAEMGSEIAKAVNDGRDLTPVLKNTLLEASRRMRDKRARFLDVLESEYDSLHEAEKILSDVEKDVEDLNRRLLGNTSLDKLQELGEENRAVPLQLLTCSFEDLREGREKLLMLEEKCDDLVERRQGTIQERNASNSFDFDFERKNLNIYLYQPLDVNYPVLADTSRTVETIKTTRNQVEKALTEVA